MLGSKDVTADTVCVMGGAQELCIAGFELPMIMLAGRWSTVETVKLYVRNIAVQHSAMARAPADAPEWGTPAWAGSQGC